MVNFERKETYSLQDLIEILRILRAPGGCPWDRAQTHLSDRRNFLEEAYEAAEAFDRDDPALMCEELGDMLMQVLFNIHIEEDAGRFTTDDVTDHICKKLIFRHPHVFGTAAADTSEEVLVNWEALKRQEKGQQTTAVLDEKGENWILNGSKIFITNAGFADVFIVIAVTDNVLDKKGRPTKLCSAFIVERTDPGFSVGKAEDKMGIRGSSTCELIFEDCRIPKDRMLGVRGKGFQLAMATLDGGRIGIASQALGIAEGALQETVAYVKERKQFGRSISAFQNTQFELAEMKARVEAAKYLVYAAALKKQEAMDGKKVRYSVEAAQAKLIAARTASDVTRRCLQLFGGYGYTRDYPIERMMRDAKITEIYEGTSEVQMMVISGALLK